MKRNFIYLLIGCPVFLFFSCKGDTQQEINTNDENIETVEEPDPVAITWADLEKDELSTETVFIIEGYLGDIGTYVDQSGGEISIPLFERRNQAAGFKLYLYVPIGNGPNNIKELPEEFLPTDVQLFCNDKTIVTVGSKVRITASKTETYTPGFISANCIKIELVDESFDAGVLTSAVALSQEMMNDTALARVYCYVDGKFDIPSIVFSYSNEISLDLKNSSVKDIATVPVRLGDGPSSMNDLPDNYTNKDLIIRDYNGETIKYGAGVRLYGTWERYSFATTTPGKFYLEEIEVRK